MRWAIGGIGLLLFTGAVLGQPLTSRPTATLTLVRNDNGTGTPTPNHWAVYADVTSPGFAGIYAFGVDLVDGSVTSIRNVSPMGVFIDSLGIEWPRPIGFSGVRGTNLDKAKFHGAHELINPDAIMEYSFGVRDGSLDQAEGRLTVGAEAEQGLWSLQSAVQRNYSAHLLLGVGTFDKVLPEFQFTSPDNVISVFLNSDGRSSRRAGASLVTFDLFSHVAQNGGSVPEPATIGLIAFLAGGLLARRMQRQMPA
jgi:hypothetical protein